MPAATNCYRFLRCRVHPSFDDVQGWFLEVRGDDSHADELQSDVLVNPASGFVAKRDLIALEEIEREDHSSATFTQPGDGLAAEVSFHCSQLLAATP